MPVVLLVYPVKGSKAIPFGPFDSKEEAWTYAYKKYKDAHEVEALYLLPVELHGVAQ